MVSRYFRWPTSQKKLEGEVIGTALPDIQARMRTLGFVLRVESAARMSREWICPAMAEREELYSNILRRANYRAAQLA